MKKMRRRHSRLSNATMLSRLFLIPAVFPDNIADLKDKLGTGLKIHGLFGRIGNGVEDAGKGMLFAHFFTLINSLNRLAR